MADKPTTELPDAAEMADPAYRQFRAKVGSYLRNYNPAMHARLKRKGLLERIIALHARGIWEQMKVMQEQGATFDEAFEEVKDQMVIRSGRDEDNI